MFALSMFLVIGAVGLSIDGARVYGAQQRLQASVDAAVLAAARVAANGGNSDDIERTFNTFFNSTAHADDTVKISDVTLTPAGRRVVVEVKGEVDTTIMPVLGFNSMQLSVGAAVAFGMNKAEIALVLDNTGSMGGIKLDALKTSAERLVDTLLDRAPEPGAIRFALVPFAQYVNVGLDKRGASWLALPADYSETTEYCRDVQPIISETNCREETYTYYSDGVAYTSTRQICDREYGDPVYTCSNETSNYAWQGCVGSRGYPDNVRDNGYATQIPGLLNTSCPSPIQSLTDDRTTLHSAISGMSANGSTYIPTGIIWGLRALSKAEPFGESNGDGKTASGETIKKFLVLMTDGANTKSATYPAHQGSDSADANRLTTESCNAAKAADVIVFTIAFEVTDPTIKSVLRGCASSAGAYFDAADASQLDASMQAIGSQITALRLTN